ncbi:MAG: glycerophosphodiester phosphodiesterase [Pseudomonadota bacterium]
MSGRTLSFPRLIGHRGVAGHAPENTLAGIRQASVFGLRWVEFDVALTADNEPVLMHDDSIDRTTNGKGKLAALALGNLEGLDAGSWHSPAFAGEAVPTLMRALETARGLGLGINVEIKPTKGRDAETGAIVAQRVAAAWPGELPPPLLSSFKIDALRAAQSAAPSVGRGYLMRRLHRGWQREAAALDCVSVHCGQRLLSRRAAAEVRQAGYRLFSYTVNDASRARLLYDWGVESLFTDYPDRLLSI